MYVCGVWIVDVILQINFNEEYVFEFLPCRVALGVVCWSLFGAVFVVAALAVVCFFLRAFRQHFASKITFLGILHLMLSVVNAMEPTVVRVVLCW